METKLRIRVMDYCATHFMTQTTFAQSIGVTPSRLSEYQHARRPIPFHLMKKLTAVFDCAPEDIFGFVDDNDDNYLNMDDGALKDEISA